ncbi:MAG: efflux RND transporter periplasmic adaptor subunit [Dysgonamonadaceae bacterium]|nr:efflux RND transporter periplasmic adaptor subunit [Dysgonamonadaceae bacterium]
MKQTVYHIFILLTCSLVFSCGKKTGSGDVSQKHETIFETGELAAVNNYSFILTRFGRYWYQMRIIGILEHGTIVNKGDSIIQLDPIEIQKYILDKEKSLETETANLEKMDVDQDVKTKELQLDLQSETATFELRKIELESAHFESERTRKIKELEFQQSKIAYAKVQRTLALHRRMKEYDRKIQEIKVNQISTKLEAALQLIPRLTLRSPVAGVFQIAINWRTDKMIKVGDNIYTGNNLANIPELENMKVNASISETDFLKIHTGQPVAVRLDALKGVVFDGEISYIGKFCHWNEYQLSKTRRKVFDVEIRILKPDERLKPGMTVSCEFLPDK